AGPAQAAQPVPQRTGKSSAESGQQQPVQPDRQEAPDIEAGKDEKDGEHIAGRHQARPESLPEQGGARDPETTFQRRTEARHRAIVGSYAVASLSHAGIVSRAV